VFIGIWQLDERVYLIYLIKKDYRTHEIKLFNCGKEKAEMGLSTPRSQYSQQRAAAATRK